MVIQVHFIAPDHIFDRVHLQVGSRDWQTSGCGMVLAILESTEILIPIQTEGWRPKFQN